MFQSLLEKTIVNRLVDGRATYEELFLGAASDHKRVQLTLAGLLRNRIVVKQAFPTAYALSEGEIARAMKRQLLKEREVNDFSSLLENPCQVAMPKKV